MLSEDSGKKLLDEMKICRLVRYNEPEVERLEREIEYVDVKMNSLKEIAKSGSISKDLSINYFLLKEYKERNRRILNGYKFSRILRIVEGNDTPSLLNDREIEFKKMHREILGKRLDKYKLLDFNSGDIPVDLYVRVVMLEDGGVIISGDRFVELKKNRIYFLRRSDVSHLLNTNVLRIVK